MSYGVTPTGFVVKDAATVVSEIDADLKGIVGASAGTEPDGSIPLRSMAGQLKTMLADAVSALWDLGSAIWSSFDPNQAGGQSQDDLCAITGTTRLPAIRSLVTALCVGDATTVLLAGRVATVTGTGSRFVSLADETIAALTPWVGPVAVVAGDIRTNVGRAYICITTGTTGSSGPTTTSLDYTDGNAHWRYLGEGAGCVAVAMEAEDAGAIAAAVYALSEIATPVAGWTAVTNPAAAIRGQALELDSDLRGRREAELADRGNTIPDGIRAKVLKVGEGTVNPTTGCTVFQNQTMTTDGAGLPAKSVEVLVLRPTTSDPDLEIAQAIFDAVGAGLETYGAVTTYAVDDLGAHQVVKYSRPTPVRIYIIADVTYDAAVYPAADVLAGGALIKAAIVLWETDYYGGQGGIGKNVRSSVIIMEGVGGPTEANGSPVAGILDVSSLKIGTTSPPTTSTEIAIGIREIATIALADIVVNLVPGTP